MVARHLDMLMQYDAPMKRYCKRLMKEEWEDLYQESAVMLMGLPDDHDVCAPFSFLRQFILNRARTMWRKNEKKEIVVAEEADATQLDMIMAKDISEKIPSHLRDVHVMSAMGYSTQEIGDITGVTKQRVHQKLKKAKEWLTKLQST